jgi:hypothetical protein
MSSIDATNAQYQTKRQGHAPCCLQAYVSFSGGPGIRQSAACRQMHSYYSIGMPFLQLYLQVLRPALAARGPALLHLPLGPFPYEEPLSLSLGVVGACAPHPIPIKLR